MSVHPRAGQQGTKILAPNIIAAKVQSKELAGEPITAMVTDATGNMAAIAGLKVVTANGWFAARPSGTEEVYKLYAESFKARDH